MFKNLWKCIDFHGNLEYFCRFPCQNFIKENPSSRHAYCGSNLVGDLCSGYLRPACFLSLRTTQHDFWSATQRGADYAKALETCRCTCIQRRNMHPVRFPNRFGAFTSAICFRNRNFREMRMVSAPKWSQNGSVRPWDASYSQLVPYLRKRK